MQCGTIRVILIGAILAGGSCATLHAQDATMTDGDACTVVLSYLSGGFVRGHAHFYFWGSAPAHWYSGTHGDITGGEPTLTGIRFQFGKTERLLDYTDINSVVTKSHTDVSFDNNKRKIAMIEFSGLSGDVDGRLVQALDRFVRDANAGHPYDCHIVTPAMVAATTATELADFQQKAAAWQAMNPKPPVSDDVTKKRLLAEDAVQEKNFVAAGEYYRAGITIDPTWAPGWYNAALISAELKDYAAAALYMKHYLILLPDASDALAAKEKVLLWEAKAEQASHK